MAKKKERRTFTDKQKLKHIERVDKLKASGKSVMDYYEKHSIASAQVANWRKHAGIPRTFKDGSNPMGMKKPGRRGKNHTPRPSFTASHAAIDLASTVESLETENEAFRTALVQVQTELRQALGR